MSEMICIDSTSYYLAMGLLCLGVIFAIFLTLGLWSMIKPRRKKNEKE